MPSDTTRFEGENAISAIRGIEQPYAILNPGDFSHAARCRKAQAFEAQPKYNRAIGRVPELLSWLGWKPEVARVRAPGEHVLRELKTFVAVSKCGSFAAAGLLIGRTQSAVSAQMHRLESVLGVRLFDRTARSIRLTAVGRAAVARAEQILMAFESIGSAVDAVEMRGTLRIGAISSVQTSMLPPVLQSFQREYPGVAVRIVPGSSLQLLAHVDSGDTDLAIIVEPPFPLPKELRWTPLVRERFVLIAPEDGGREHSWRDYLSHRRLVRYDRGSLGGRLVDQLLRRNRINADDAIELDDLAAAARMVSLGLGVALIPQCAGVSIEGVRIVDLGRSTVFRKVGAVSRTRDLQDHARALMDRLVSMASGDGASRQARKRRR